MLAAKIGKPVIGCPACVAGAGLGQVGHIERATGWTDDARGNELGVPVVSGRDDAGNRLTAVRDLHSFPATDQRQDFRRALAEFTQANSPVVVRILNSHV